VKEEKTNENDKGKRKLKSPNGRAIEESGAYEEEERRKEL